MIIDYKINKIINESKPVADFKRGLILKEVEFEATSIYSTEPTVVKMKIDSKRWREAKKYMSISL